MVLWDPSNCPTRIAITEIIIKMYLFQERANGSLVNHDDVIKSKHFPPFVRGIQRSSMDSPHKGQWHGALMFSLICVWINGWVNSREAGDLRRYRTHCDVTVMVDRHANIAHRVNALCSRVDSKDFWRLQKQGQLTWSTVMSSRKEHVMWVLMLSPLLSWIFCWAKSRIDDDLGRWGACMYMHVILNMLMNGCSVEIGVVKFSIR